MKRLLDIIAVALVFVRIRQRCRMGPGLRQMAAIASVVFFFSVPRFGHVRAETVGFKMTGTVTVYDPTFVLPSDVSSGALFTAFLTYERGVPDTVPDDTKRGTYKFNSVEAVHDLSLKIGTLELQIDSLDDFFITVTNDSPAIGLAPDGDFFVVHGVKSLGGPNVAVPQLQVLFINDNGAAWNSDTLPRALELSHFDRADILASGGVEPLGRPYSITARVTEIIAIPEPSTEWLVHIAVVGLAAAAIRRQGGTVELSVPLAMPVLAA
jgi:hypothetical protein